MAQRLRFTRDFDFPLNKWNTRTIAFKKGEEYLVVTAAAKAAIEAGAARVVAQDAQQVTDAEQR